MASSQVICTRVKYVESIFMHSNFSSIYIYMQCGHGTVKPATHFDAEVDAAALRKAIKA